MYRVILFDLDGTLTASGEGITKCVQYALEKSGIHEPDLKKLECFIGPPLMEQFRIHANMSEEEARQAVVWYRERYSVTGIYENRPYEGIPRLLSDLKEHGYILGVASSKPEHYVLQILEHFHIIDAFSVIVGSEMNGQRTRKAEVIREALRRLGPSISPCEVIMVGDKEHDVLGARECGIECVCAGYGYGTEEELAAAQPLKIVRTVQELADFFF
ncbi:MAG: HAD-IA family hydrolase [Eubacteriales bacterium]|nr:HAD-IA family hydrolase [Eubacteriales bacterium]